MISLVISRKLCGIKSAKWMFIAIGTSFALIFFVYHHTKTSAEDVNVLCWVLTSPDNYKRKAIHVKNTWGKRCNTFLLMSSANDKNPDTIALQNTREGHDFLWGKTLEALQYIWKHHKNDADWFLKADDDTFVIVENLRLLLHQYDAQDSIYFGAKFKYQPFPNNTGGYMTGGAGYVLSKEALRRFIEEAIPDESKCRGSFETAEEDVQLAKCMDNIGVRGVDTRDELGRHRFLNFDPSTHLTMKDSHWYWDRIYYPQNKGMNCCSERAISFHYLAPNTLHTLEYLIYHLRPN